MKKQSSEVKIGLIQMRCEKAALTENLNIISQYIAEAEEKGIDILALPEASITGYNDRMKHPEAVIPLDGAEIDAVLNMTKGREVTVLAGFIETNPGSKPFVTQAVIRDGQLIGCYRKKTIVDDDINWLTPGETVAVFTHDDLKFGIAICSDLVNEEIFADCARQGAQIVFELAAPGLHGEQSTRNWRSGFEWWEGECRKYLEGYAQKYGIWIAVATQSGRTIDEDFPGGGYVFAPDGHRAYATPDWSPGAVYLSLDLKTHEVTEL